MKKRYSLFLEGELPHGVNEATITFPVDMRTVIPVSLRQKKFMLYSAFHSNGHRTAAAGATAHNMLVVGVDLPQADNKSSPKRPYMVIGMASARFDPNEFPYYYSESESMVRMVDYPEISEVRVHVRSATELNFGFQQDDPALGIIDNNVFFFLNLTFEELGGTAQE